MCTLSFSVSVLRSDVGFEAKSEKKKSVKGG